MTFTTLLRPHIWISVPSHTRTWYKVSVYRSSQESTCRGRISLTGERTWSRIQTPYTTPPKPWTAQISQCPIFGKLTKLPLLIRMYRKVKCTRVTLIHIFTVSTTLHGTFIPSPPTMSPRNTCRLSRNMSPWRKALRMMSTSIPILPLVWISPSIGFRIVRRFPNIQGMVYGNDVSLNIRTLRT